MFNRHSSTPIPCCGYGLWRGGGGRAVASFDAFFAWASCCCSSSLTPSCGAPAAAQHRHSRQTQAQAQAQRKTRRAFLSPSPPPSLARSLSLVPLIPPALKKTPTDTTAIPRCAPHLTHSRAVHRLLLELCNRVFSGRHLLLELRALPRLGLRQLLLDHTHARIRSGPSNLAFGEKRAKILYKHTTSGRS